MAYSELIKNFERVRSYMREFYIYGFKSRNEFKVQSARSYDNERRRVESWLGDYMSFRRDASGKNVFLSVDSRSTPHNPLYQAFKAKSFTDKDITLHFYILDLLADGAAMSVGQIASHICEEYLVRFRHEFSLDESTIRKKLKEYETLGLLRREKRGRETVYRRTDSNSPDLVSWTDALAFFSEADPLGVIGSYLLDRSDEVSDVFRFKHHYILHDLDSDILCQLLEAIEERRAVEVTCVSLRGGREYRQTVCPLKIYLSTQTGRQYLLGYHYCGRQMTFLRVDTIRKAAPGNVEKQYDRYLRYYENFSRNLWGVSIGTDGPALEHLEMTVHIGPGEEHIWQRLEREKRHGTLERLDERTAKFSADVYDAAEMLPWLRTFIGRITNLKCSSQYVIDTFYEDLKRMGELYGGETDVVP